MPYFKDILNNFLSKCCQLSKSRREVAIEMARKKLNKELNIIEIVKSWRYFGRALHYLLPEKKRFDLKEKARYKAINPDECPRISFLRESKRR